MGFFCSWKAGMHLRCQNSQPDCSCWPVPCRYLIGDSPPWWQIPLLKASSLFIKTPAQGAATSIYLASSGEVEGVSSKYYADCQPLASSKASYDVDGASRLWEVSQELTGAEIDASVPVVT